MSKHTPGPWFIEDNVIRGDKQHNRSVTVGCVLDIAYPFGRRAGDSTHANARLIAAAPELLEACKVALGIIGFGAEHDQISAAIAKATGEQA